MGLAVCGRLELEPGSFRIADGCRADLESCVTMTLREFLEHHTLTRAVVDRYLDPDANNWACFDPELGYLLKTSASRDGLNWCTTTSTHEPGGPRKVIHYAGQPVVLSPAGPGQRILRRNREQPPHPGIALRTM